jgi:hypothetical protein
MTRKVANARPGKAAAIAESAADASTAASRAGISLSEEDAAWVANKMAQRDAAFKAVRATPYSGHEPANTFRPAG